MHQNVAVSGTAFRRGSRVIVEDVTQSTQSSLEPLLWKLSSMRASVRSNRLLSSHVLDQSRGSFFALVFAVPPQRSRFAFARPAGNQVFRLLDRRDYLLNKNAYQPYRTRTRVWGERRDPGWLFRARGEDFRWSGGAPDHAGERITHILQLSAPAWFHRATLHPGTAILLRDRFTSSAPRECRPRPS